jgi:hypothetical protein
MVLHALISSFFPIKKPQKTKSKPNLGKEEGRVKNEEKFSAGRQKQQARPVFAKLRLGRSLALPAIRAHLRPLVPS